MGAPSSVQQGLSDLSDLSMAIAMTAWHEAMHVKVEPIMMQADPNWDQHNLGGNWGSTISFNPNGSFESATHPDRTSSDLMRQHMGRAA